MLKLDGKAVAEVRQRRLAGEISKLSGDPPHLAVVLVGEDPASQVYVRNKVRACERVGVVSKVHSLSESVSEGELRELLVQLNQSGEVSGILVQLPLPQKFQPHKVLSWVAPEKDVDGLCVENIGQMWSGRPRVLPCTPAGIIKILEHYQIELVGRSAVVVGRSQIVGLPMAYLLQRAQATVTIGHSRTKDLASYTRQADILVVAMGRPRFLGPQHVKEGAVVIDVGIHRQEGGGLCGDVQYEELEGVASAMTPVPGGVGPMTISMLLENTYHLSQLR